MIKKYYILFLVIISLTVFSFNYYTKQKTKDISQSSVADSVFIENILKKYPEHFSKIISNSKKYEVQIIYTQINRDENNVPSFKQYTYGISPQSYFYAASMVKLPCSVLALEKINEIKTKVSSLDKYSTMFTDSAYTCQKKIISDNTSKNKKPSVAHYIKRMLLISDDEAYDRIYEFIGKDEIHQRLGKKGFKNIRIVHRFDHNCNSQANKYSNPVSFYDESGKQIYSQPQQVSEIKYENPLGSVKKGIGYINSKNKFVKEPKDFTNMNYMTLQDVHDILKTVIFPNSVSENQRFNLTKEDYCFLYNYLSMYPRESDYPSYSPLKYEDSYKKYFMYGTYHNKTQNDSVRIYNIVGQSYGYLSDCAYIINYDRKIEFMLAAVIYVNKDGVLNDGKYEYKTIGFPFLSSLGNVFYNYELQRKKQFLPDLNSFKCQ